MLIPIDLLVDDYTCAQMPITAADITSVKEHVSTNKKPSTPVLHYITENSTSIYKNRLPLNGIEGSSFENKEDKIIVQNNTWKNAIAFETSAGDKLVKIAFVGAGSNDACNTIVHTPPGTIQVKGVGWDGMEK